LETKKKKKRCRRLWACFKTANFLCFNMESTSDNPCF